MLKIERLNTDDWKRLQQIRLAALAEAPYAFGSTFQETTVRPKADWTAQIASLPTFVAVLQELDSGIVRCSPRPDSEDTADLISMWVAPNARGIGVGEALVDAVINWGRSEGYTRLLLDVSEGNSFAIALYKRKGFKATGRTSRFPPPRQHILEYEMALSL